MGIRIGEMNPRDWPVSGAPWEHGSLLVPILGAWPYAFAWLVKEFQYIASSPAGSPCQAQP